MPMNTIGKAHWHSIPMITARPVIAIRWCDAFEMLRWIARASVSDSIRCRTSELNCNVGNLIFVSGPVRCIVAGRRILVMPGNPHQTLSAPEDDMNPGQRSEMPLHARIEAALILLAYFIEQDGDIHVPMYEKFERELEALRTNDDACARARERLAAFRADRAGKMNSQLLADDNHGTSASIR